MQTIQNNHVQDKIIEIRDQKIIIDADVAELYGVETKRVNEAVKNNPEKFPDGYLILLEKRERNELVEFFDRFKKLKHSTAQIKGFTEKGLYMLATILKSPKAVDTTLTIIDTFFKIRELNHTTKQIQALPDDSPKQKILMEHAGKLITDLIVSDKTLEVSSTETMYEINFAILKIKKTIKKNK